MRSPDSMTMVLMAPRSLKGNTHSSRPPLLFSLGVAHRGEWWVQEEMRRWGAEEGLQAWPTKLEKPMCWWSHCLLPPCHCHCPRRVPAPGACDGCGYRGAQYQHSRQSHSLDRPGTLKVGGKLRNLSQASVCGKPRWEGLCVMGTQFKPFWLRPWNSAWQTYSIVVGKSTWILILHLSHNRRRCSCMVDAWWP